MPKKPPHPEEYATISFHPNFQAVRSLALGTALLGSALALGACGSSSHSTNASAARLYGTPLQQDCTNVANVLSDGPDPVADPVGYAEAQILGLRQLKIKDQSTLSSKVDQLATAYSNLSSAHGNTTANSLAVSRAQTALNAICPDAAP